MRRLKTKPFPYYVGLHSLEELVTREHRVCVMNILGSESRKVTPVSHEYSGGNIVAGVQYGRRGSLDTKIGSIPVYRSIREVMEKGIAFDMGVVYIPPQGVCKAVSELVTHNEALKRIVIVTEKVPARDSRNIRALCQEAGVDVIGANCLGMANAWDRVRIGGSLGGDHPDETLVKGSIAIHSNSGNFTTTMAEYLRTAGFGISTAVSSGKDVYIHFALPEFLYAAQNDPRTKAVVIYVEPGGYYEKMALDWIKDRTFGFTKPIIACVTGRWKKNITRACGHAGALSGSGDDAESKERWFDEYFGVDVFDPKTCQVSKRGVRVSSIQYIPDAVRAVYEKIDEAPDFPTTGDLSLKLWLGDSLVKLPPSLDLPISQAPAPYDHQIIEVNKQVGAHYLRQNMADKSGASRMSPETQVAELHGKTVLDLSLHTLEENLFFSLAKVLPEKADVPTLNLILNLFMKIDERRMELIDVGRANGCLPNACLASQIALVGDKELLAKSRDHSRFIIDLIREFGLNEHTKTFPPELDAFVEKHLLRPEPSRKTDVSELLFKEVKKSRKSCVALKVCQHIIDLAEKRGLEIRDTYEFLLATIAVCVLWNPMLEKRISRQLVEDAVTYFYLMARVVAYSVVNREHNPHWKKLVDQKLSNLNHSFTENAYKVLFGHVPTPLELLEFQTVLGLTLTNGPGTLSSKGAKESVSARNDISMAFVGFLANTGRAHGGNGYEAIEFLLEQFRGVELADPGDPAHGLDLKGMANRAARAYGAYKKQAQEVEDVAVKPIPCINHPVFRGNKINVDPREQFVSGMLAEKGVYNAFWEFYRLLVKELYAEGVTKNVFCVNVDAVLAVITLKLVWKDYQAGRISLRQVQELAFTLFLFGRTIGATAEIADHRDRGMDLDCRTPERDLTYVL
ncbi:MAG: CoA-binding protein [Geothrix sp.]|uniref:CoA-binding protein n=1 Tax=Candidatus Geothrix odensensis TaxID=2954440 RepID=A0A936F230_9BACT|nr:CoA-binding protein [Holophagaceae bacterium]MBK8572591.1 CoA-binding protein [Candidatus Geothrix odensensis]MBK8789971.1 CoA-binding protein [Holophagaceae bacterium]MCC6512708.1 CoA-binding protein [Geothrix sp.]